MASACVNNHAADHVFGWLSPRISFSRDPEPSPGPKLQPEADLLPGEDSDFLDFEFRLHDPVAMLPADELFSGGKLVPLHLPKPPPPPPLSFQSTPLKPSRKEELMGAVSGPEIFALSPKAPTCTSRWRDLLQRKRQLQKKKKGSSTQKPDPVSQNQNPNPRSSALKQFLHRRSSLASDPNLNLPLLREPEYEALSLSSSTSEEISRLSLDSDMRPNTNPILLNRNPPRPRISSRSPAPGDRAGRAPARRSADTPPPICASDDSPRMNASGRVVFQGLGRSSSSPSTFNGGPTRNNKYRGMERSYSNNVRVINVPVPACSVFGFLGSGPKNIGPKGKN